MKRRGRGGGGKRWEDDGNIIMIIKNSVEKKNFIHSLSNNWNSLQGENLLCDKNWIFFFFSPAGFLNLF